jgi:membrane fusion protein (multidrug efflux system)
MPRIVIVLLLAAAACRPAATAPTAPPQQVPVETIEVATEDVDVTVRAVGTLRADQAVEVKPKRPGHIRELRLTEGARVTEGDVLVVLDDDDLRARVDVARATVTDAEVREANARKQYERSRALQTKGVASQQEYDDAAAELDRAVAGLGVAKANLAFATAQLAETVVRAPFGGILGERVADLGAFVKDGEPLVTLVDPDPIEIVFAVPERYLGEVRMEQPVDVRVVSHDRGFPGTVTFIAPQVDPVNRTATVKAVIPNADFLLRPGQFATVDLHLDRHVDAPVVPEEVIVPDGDRSLVFVVADGTATARPIRTGVRLPGRVEVVEGLRAGEKIVRTGHEKLRIDTAMPVREIEPVQEG